MTLEKPEKIKRLQEPPPIIGTRRDLFTAEDQRRGTLRYLTPDVIDQNPTQPRQTINRESLEELKKSIAERGILQPLLAVKGTEGHVTLVAGQRRLIASRELGLRLVPVMIIDQRPDLTFDAISENVQRESLDPIDEGEALQRLAEEHNYSHSEIGNRIGKSKQYVTDRIRLAVKLSHRAKGLLYSVEQAHVDNLNARAFDSENSHTDLTQINLKAKFSIARAVSFLPEKVQEAAVRYLLQEINAGGRTLTTREVEERLTRFKAGISLAELESEMVKTKENNPGRRKGNQGRSKAQRVDGRQFESFKALAQLAQLKPVRALNLDLDTAIRLMEADLERLKRLKSEE